MFKLFSLLALLGLCVMQTDTANSSWVSPTLTPPQLQGSPNGTTQGNLVGSLGRDEHRHHQENQAAGSNTSNGRISRSSANSTASWNTTAPVTPWGIGSRNVN